MSPIIFIICHRSRSREVKHFKSVAAIIVFVIVAFCVKDNVIYTTADQSIDLNVNTMNGLEAIAENDYTKYVVTGDDPYIVLDGTDERIDSISIRLESEEVTDLPLQVFYAKDGQAFSADNSTTAVVDSENGIISCDIPDGNYSILRIDFEQDLQIGGISALGYAHPNYLIMAVYILVCLGICCLLWFFIDKIFLSLDAGVDFVYNFFVDKKIKCWHIFAVIAIIIGGIYSVIIPPLQVPDEQAHVSFMEQELGITGISQQIGEYYANSGMSNLPTHYDVKVDRTIFDEHKHDRFDKSAITWTSVPSPLLVRHLPSAVGLLLGMLVNLPIYYCLTLAELFALFFYVVVSYLALKIMPFKREFFMAIMLLPMALQQCSSLNYDAMVIPMSFLLIAICFDCIYGERVVNWKTIMQLLFITVIIVFIKIPYILILLVLLLVPRTKWDLKIKNIDLVDLVCRFWPIVLVFGIGVVAVGMYVFRHNFFVEIMIACAYDIKHYIHIIINTLKQYGRFYVSSSIGVFGWLETPMPARFCSSVIIFMFFLAMQSDKRDSKYKVNCIQRVVCLGLFVVMTVFLITALLSWNFKLDGLDVYTLSFNDFVDGIKRYDVSLGIQGRYFIPMIFLLGIPVHGIFNVKKSYIAVVQCIYYVIMAVWTIDVLMLRYWC